MTFHRIFRTARGFSLIEAVAIVLVVSIAVPPGLAMLSEVTERRADAAAIERATTLAIAVLERVTADVHAGDDAGLGYAALADEESYLDDPIDGLRARMQWVSEPYEAAGLRWEIEVGEPAAADGAATGDTERDVFRRVTARVTFPTVLGDRTLELATLVGEL